MFDYVTLPYVDVSTTEHGKVKTIRVCRASIMHCCQLSTLQALIGEMTLSESERIAYNIGASLMAVCECPKTGKLMFDIDISSQANAEIYAKNHKDKDRTSEQGVCGCEKCLKDRKELQQGEVIKFCRTTASMLLGRLLEASKTVNPEEFDALETTLAAKKKST